MDNAVLSNKGDMGTILFRQVSAYDAGAFKNLEFKVGGYTMKG